MTFDDCQLLFLNKGHGFRNDLFTMLKDLKPGFMRFPGTSTTSNVFLSIFNLLNSKSNLIWIIAFNIKYYKIYYKGGQESFNLYDYHSYLVTGQCSTILD